MLRVVVFSVLFASGFAIAQETLCRQAEAIVFSCHVGKKVVSLCRTGEHPRQLFYRYGLPQRIELSYPDSKKNEKADFLASTKPLFGGGITSVSFARGGYQYSVYSKLGRSGGSSPQERVPEFEDGITITREGKTVRRMVCDDGGEGFREKIDWIPSIQPK